MNSLTTSKTEPGIYKGIKMSLFSNEEKIIIQMLARRYWRVTRAERVSLSNSLYTLVLIKPTENITHSFNLQREVVAVFSSYDEFQPRAVEALDYLSVSNLRVEEICCLLFSKDKDVERNVSQLIKSNQEARVIVPFSYSELLENENDDEFINNKIRQHFYSRDLFGIQDPLKKDLYFFGRTDIIQQLVNKHLNHENGGLFGLRKTGKTSILYGVERAIDRKHSMSCMIDCQTLHMKPWNLALYAIIEQLYSNSKFVKKDMIHSQKDYCDEYFASDYFESDIHTISIKNKKKILLIFDEIEHITFGTSASEGWRSGDYFLKFWQVLRSTYQRTRNDEFSYLITGTNPSCIERATINGVDNPIFMQFSPLYIPAFTFSQTEEMVNKLGGYMGLKFDESVSNALVEDFGGHPLLMRQMCSYIHQQCDTKRPVEIVKICYNDLKDQYYQQETSFVMYAEMVLKVLQEWYSDEYQMLQWLSIGDEDTFNGLAKISKDYVNHLCKYGIIDEYNGRYYFKNNALRFYLSQRNLYKKLNLTQEERQQEISERRNRIEPQLRKIVRQYLKNRFGEATAKEKVINELFTPKQRPKYQSFSYMDLFDPNKSQIYLSNLFSLILKNWDEGFNNIFGSSRDLFDANSKLINIFRKPDAHAAEISEAQFTSFRGAMSWMEELVQEYNQ